MPEFKGVVTVAVLSSGLDKVIKGYCEKSNTRRLPSDETSARDHRNGASLNEDAGQCVRRILRTHLRIPEHDLETLSLVSVRQPKVNAKRTGRVYVVQYFFLAVLKEYARPSFSLNRSSDIVSRNFVDVLTALASWQLDPGVRRNVDGARAWSGGNRNRMNPYHALNLARSLVILRDCIGDDPSGESFRQMLARLVDYGIPSLDRCIDEIGAAMVERRV